MNKSLSLALLVLLGCSDAGPTGPTGVLRIRASGEAASVSGYPTTTGGRTFAFADGFSLSFTHVYVGLEDLRLETADGQSAHFSSDSVVVDLHAGPAQIWEATVPAQRWDRVSYRTKVPGHSDRLLGAVDFDAVHIMLTGGHAIFVTGTATQGNDTFNFYLGFPPVHQTECEAGDGTLGILIPEGAVTEAEVTLKLDHLFFDSLAAEVPDMRFEPFAAAEIDGDITNAYLSQSIADLRDRNGNPLMSGGSPIVYDPGPHVISPMSLEQYVRAAASTMGHWNGEGHCRNTPSD